MMTLQDLINRVRLEIGDPLMPFRTSALSDGSTTWFDLPNQQLQDLTVTTVSGVTITEFTDFSNAVAWSSITAYSVGNQVTYQTGFFTALESSTNQTPVSGGNAHWADNTSTSFVANNVLGQVQLGAPPVNNTTLIMSGNSWSLFSDTELSTYCMDSVREHFYGRHMQERFYDSFGRITFRETPINLSNMPAVEEPLVSSLAVINTMWVMANDTATSFNINTAEGTNIDRTSQYKQITNQIALLQGRYQEYCAQLNVGMYRAEVMELRRTSYTTGRLVPLFEPREYDDHRWPSRILPPVDRKNEDQSGIPSQWNANGQGV
jgi:hypothetical protein